MPIYAKPDPEPEPEPEPGLAEACLVWRLLKDFFERRDGNLAKEGAALLLAQHEGDDRKVLTLTLNCLNCAIPVLTPTVKHEGCF